jgi:hypothetical protein
MLLCLLPYNGLSLQQLVAHLALLHLQAALERQHNWVVRV